MRVRVPPKLFNPFQIGNQMSKFKVGDRVKCISQSVYPHSPMVGHNYTVTALRGDNEVHVDGGWDSWYNSRFELIPQFKSGDPVLCVNGSAPELEANRIYLIDSVSDGGAIVINGKPWSPARFTASTVEAYEEQKKKPYIDAIVNRSIIPPRLWYIHGGPKNDNYMRDDGTFHYSMATGGGTYYETRELAQAALDRARGIKPVPVVAEPPKPTRPFRIGDTVVCRDINMCNDKLELNKSYEVAYIYKETGRLEFNGVNSGGVGWDTDRFVLGKEAPTAAMLDVTPCQNINITTPPGASVSVNGHRVDGSIKKPEPKFRKGDIVTCVDDGGWMNVKKGRQYVVNEWYDSPAVCDSRPGSVSVIGANNGDTSHYAAWRFELAVKPVPKFKSGDRVVCTNSGDNLHIHVGKEYTVKRWYDNPALFDSTPGSVWLEDADEGDSSHYSARLFRLAPANPPEAATPDDTPPLKTGDEVVCINPQDGVEKGNRYVISKGEYKFNGATFVKIEGDSRGFLAFRFQRPQRKPSPIFTAGDLIVCVDVSPREDGPAHNLVQGGIYRVDSTTNAAEGHQLVSAESHGSTYPRQKGDWLASWRFEKYKGAAKPDRGPSPLQDLLNKPQWRGLALREMQFWAGTLLPSQFTWPSIVK